jgi:hypothetical protein
VLLAGAALAAGGTPPDGAWRDVAASLQPAGSGRLDWFGLRLYDARLWVGPGFRADAFDRHAFALELHYLRDFRAADIARRSLQEMERAAAIPAAQARQWQDQLQRLLPDVRAGDRIAGAHLPGRGARFFVNGRPAGEIDDPRFASLFFGIWLAPSTSEPRLREALLAGTPP